MRRYEEKAAGGNEFTDFNTVQARLTHHASLKGRCAQNLKKIEKENLQTNYADYFL